MFDEPFDMLTLCHEKVRRFAALTGKLKTHVQRHGADDAASQAATSILRYFNLAAPLHHADEERDVYPALRKHLPEVSDARRIELERAINDLEAEHAHLADLWDPVRIWLEQLEEKKSVQPPDCVEEFVMAYPRHADREELEIYPFAVMLSLTERQELGLKMVQRRRATETY
jgi:hemerythrin-like domain-containing protein